MKPFSPTPVHRRTHRRVGGMTLIEIMIALGIAAVVTLLVGTIFLSSNRAFADIGNYVSMNRANREVLEQMSRDIRKSSNLISFATNRLELNFSGSTNLIFTYDAAKRQLTRSKTGEADKCLLTDCDALQFSMYKNVPMPGGTFETTTDPALGKSISVSWKCTRTVLGQKRDSETSEEALIVIRNKPML